MTESHPASTAACPRCGYDQRGVIATWTDRCPVSGACTECGLDYEWRDLLNPALNSPRWCVEHRHSLGRAPIACLQTLMWSFLPWRFWSRLRMSHPVRGSRIAAYLCFLLLFLLAPYVLVQTTVAIYVRYAVQQELKKQTSQNALTLQLLQRDLQSTDESATSERQRLQREISKLQQMQASLPTVQCSYLLAVFEAVFTPLANSSWGTMSWGGNVGPYIPPASLYNLIINRGRFTGTTLGPRTVEIVSCLRFIVLGLIAMLFLPVSFVLLPISRRRAKVRWAHIVRVTAYSFFIPVAVVCACVLIAIAGISFDIAGRWPLRAIAGVCSLGFALMLIVWWEAAIRCYLRMRHGLAVAILMLLLCVLTVVALTFFATSAFIRWL